MKIKTMMVLGIAAIFLVGTLNPVVLAGSAEAAGDRSSMVLRFGIHVSEMGHLDPHMAAGSQDRALADMVFSGLLRYRPGQAPLIEPDLAEHIPGFEMIGGRQVWTVHLRKGVWFHAGPQTPAYELTADDVVFSLQKSARRESCAYAGEYEDMRVEAVDRYTVRIILAKPISSILFLPKLTNYAGGFIVSRRAIEAMGHDYFKRHPVGTGPFVFDHYTAGDTLVLKAHDRYFRGQPLLDGVEFQFMPVVEQRESALLAGELDVIMGSGHQGWLERIAAQKGILVDAHGVGEVATIYFNTAIKPLNDVRVRQAIAHALNRQGFLDTTSRQFVGPVYSPVPSSFLPGGLSRDDAEQLHLDYPEDLAKARQLLADAGFADGFALALVSSEKRLYRTYYEEMRRQLLQIGIDCRISIESHSNMHALIRRQPKPIVVYVAWRPNADAYLSRFFHSDAIIVSGTKPDTNFSHFDKVDGLIEAARLEIDPQRQTQLWEQAQIRILDEMVAYPIMYTKQCYARSARVDYGHPLKSTMALYPQFTEKTRLVAMP